jgi:hypothetical protein
MDAFSCVLLYKKMREIYETMGKLEIFENLNEDIFVE